MARETLEIAKGVHLLSIKDFGRLLFDAFIPLDKGTTYNSYLVIGSEKKALIDTTNPGFEEELLSKIASVCKPEELDYVVMNHAEPDHANAIPLILSIAKKAKLLTGIVGAKAAEDYYRVPKERIEIVNEKTRIDLGGKTLRFIDAPWLHWPETIFTYLEEEGGILFPCDFFGQHLAIDGKNLDTDLETFETALNYAKKYYGEIMMPFGKYGERAIGKIKKLPLKMIAPSHGVVFTTPEKIIPAYLSWTKGETRRKAVILHVSMWGSSAKLSKMFEGKFREKGIEFRSFDLVDSDLSEISGELVDSIAIVFAVPTVLNRAHPLGANIAYVVSALEPPAKYYAIVSSYGWNPSAAKTIENMLKGTKMELVGTLEEKAKPTEADLKRAEELAEKLAGLIMTSQE